MATQLVGEEDESFIGVRLSDGFANVTVYQWLPERFRHGSPARFMRATKDARGVAYFTAGDVSPEVCKKITAAFIEYADR